VSTLAEQYKEKGNLHFKNQEYGDAIQVSPKVHITKIQKTNLKQYTKAYVWKSGLMANYALILELFRIH
jgi:hypothetical protein